METAVKVITASRHDSTHEVGAAIAARLTALDHRAEALPVAEAAELGSGPIVLGSAVYMGRWLKPARKLAARLAAESREAPLWLFSVGPIGEPPKPEVPPVEALVGAELAGAARGYRLFPGRLERESLGRLERIAVDAQKAPDGDFRDWEAVESWVGKIAAAL